MKNKVLSILGLVLIAVAVSSFTFEVSNDVPQSYVIINQETGVAKVIFSNTKDNKERALINAIQLLKSNKAIDCNCATWVVDPEMGRCVTACEIPCPSEDCVGYQEHDCCIQPKMNC